MKTFALCLTLLSICGTIFAASIPGGKTRITDEQQLKDLTKKVTIYLEKINEKEDKAQLELIRPHSATVQVVDGTHYEMDAEINENGIPVDCKVNLWEKPWMKFVRMDVECGKNSKYSYESFGFGEVRHIIGKFHDMTGKQLKQLEPKLSAVFDNLRRDRDDFDYTLKRMISGKQQVVAGMNYNVIVEATNYAEQVEQCEAEIFKNLLGELQQVNIKCGGKSFHYPGEVELSTPGAKTRITDETQLKDLTKKVSFYLGKIGEQNKGVELELIRSYSATKQVVAGFLYEMFAKINENGTPVDCNVKLWEQSWMNFARMEVECGKEKRKYTYESGSHSEALGVVVGGFRKMSQERLDELEPKLSAVFDHLKDEQDNFVYTLKRMISGKQQVVAGMHYIVTVEATNNAEQVKQCEADIFQNLRGEFQQVDVKCGGKSFRYTQY